MPRLLTLFDLADEPSAVRDLSHAGIGADLEDRDPAAPDLSSDMNPTAGPSIAADLGPGPGDDNLPSCDAQDWFADPDHCWERDGAGGDFALAATITVTDGDIIRFDSEPVR